MARTELEIRRTVTVETEEIVTVVVDVPQSILDNPDADFGLHDWVEGQLKVAGSDLAKQADDPMNGFVEDETVSWEIDEVSNLGPHD
jgi:hypothetical protein